MLPSPQSDTLPPIISSRLSFKSMHLLTEEQNGPQFQGLFVLRG